MIRRIRFDSSNKNNNFNNYGRNNVSFGGPLIKYGFPQRKWDEFSPRPMSREEKFPTIVKYGVPERDWDEFGPRPMIRGEKFPTIVKYGVPERDWGFFDFEADEGRKKDIREKMQDHIFKRYGIKPQNSVQIDETQTLESSDIPPVEPEESDEDIAKEINKDLFPEEDNGDGVEKPKAEVPKQKTSYFKRLWCAILGKDAQ